MKLLLASSNPHKVEEIRAIWSGLAAEDHQAPPALIGLEALARTIDPPVEDQLAFEGNAVVKARHYGRAATRPCLADDSGLEVDALNGRPGVHSARFAGVEGPRPVVDRSNNRLLLDQLDGIPIKKRTARFVCVIALCRPHGTGGTGGTGAAASQTQPATDNNEDTEVLAIAHGTVEGRILTREEAGLDARGRGDHGFGYDPLFYVPDLDKTTAELLPREKNRISHRANAARIMYRKVMRLLEHEWE